MSDTTAAPLQSAELVDARRFCGYPAYGAGASGFQSWRFFTAYGMLEFRLANLSDDEIKIVRNYLAQLGALEAAIVGAADNLDTDKAAVWTRNPGEVADREALFTAWRARLCGFLGVPLGPALVSSFDIRI